MPGTLQKPLPNAAALGTMGCGGADAPPGTKKILRRRTGGFTGKEARTMGAPHYTVALQKVAAEQGLTVLHAAKDYATREIRTADVNRPGLQLAGFYNYFDPERLQIIGRVESTYLETLTPDQRRERFAQFMHYNIIGLVICHGMDPFPECLEMAEKYGADALRFNLITGNSPGNDMRFYVEKCEAMRNFCNKIWNASRFVMMNLTIDHVELPKKLELEDKWILSKLNTLIREVTDNMDAFELGVASAKIYDFIWDNYCDWFIELTKNRLNSEDQTTRENAQNVLCYVLIETLKLLHPFMPFITEEIWQALPHEGEFLMLSKWPEYNEKFSFPAEEEAMQTVIEAITAIRARRNEMNVAPSKKVHYTVATAHADTFSAGIPFFTRLASASDVTIVPADAAIDADGKVEVDTHAARIFMPLAELVDFEKELARIAKEKANAEKQLAGIENKLKNEGFLAKAPEAVVNGARADAEKLKALIEKLDASAAAMKK